MWAAVHPSVVGDISAIRIAFGASELMGCSSRWARVPCENLQLTTSEFIWPKGQKRDALAGFYAIPRGLACVRKRAPCVPSRPPRGGLSTAPGGGSLSSPARVRAGSYGSSSGLWLDLRSPACWHLLSILGSLLMPFCPNGNDLCLRDLKLPSKKDQVDAACYRPARCAD